jgi:hypothetical protein
MHTLWSRRRRLSQRAEEILNKDKVLEREGVTSLSLEELRSVNIFRHLFLPEYDYFIVILN